MRGAPLMVSSNEMARITEVLQYADIHRFNIQDLKRIIAGEAEPAGDNPAFEVMLPMGYRVVYTIEEHPGGWAKHISVSTVPRSSTLTGGALNRIMQLFGFRHDLAFASNAGLCYDEGEVSPENKGVASVIEFLDDSSYQRKKPL